MSPSRLPSRTRPPVPPPEGAALGEWLGYAEGLLTASGAAFGQIATNAHDEALALLLHAVRLPLDSGPKALQRRLSPAESAAAAALLRRRAEDHVPVAYLTGEAWLGGLRFQVDERVLIPRSYFVEVIPGLAAAGPVADVCTGSGCLAILLARHFPGAEVDGIDIEAGALEVAAANVRTHRLGRRVHLFRSDLFESVPARRYGLIVSNPPYEPTARVDALPPEFKREPRLALDGGRDGLGIIRRLLAQAGERLARDGRLLIEVGGLRRAIDREFAALRPEWLPTGDGSDCIAAFRAENLAAAPRP